MSSSFQNATSYSNLYRIGDADANFDATRRGIMRGFLYFSALTVVGVIHIRGDCAVEIH